MKTAILWAWSLILAATALAIPAPHRKHHGDPNTKLVAQALNITTIAANDRKESTLECWSVSQLKVSDTPGTAGALVASLGTPAALSSIVIPPKFDGGLHNAPVVQYVYFAGGEAKISLPTSLDTATVKGGPYGLILATDLKEVSTQGHTTVYPSHEQTIGVAIPLANNTIPKHTVLHAGACTGEDSKTFL